MDSNQLPIAPVDDAVEEPRYHGDYDLKVTMQDIQAAFSSRSPWRYVAGFTPEAVYECGLSPGQFFKRYKIFKSCNDGQIIYAIPNKAISANVLSSPSTMTVEECIALITWMKSAAGQKIVQGVRKQVKLEKMTPQGHDVIDATLIRVLQLQMHD